MPEKPLISINIDNLKIKPEIHVHPQTKLTQEEREEITKQAIHQFGLQMSEQIRKQFGSI